MKKIIAVAIAALPMAAMADVTIYGKVAGGIESDRGFDGVSNTRVSDYTSRIGFKGSEDLGNGLKAIWQLESRFKVDGEQAGCGFHAIRPPSPLSSGQAFHGHLATCSTAIRPGSRSAATQGLHC